MALTTTDVKKIAHLARLNISEAEKDINTSTTHLSNILKLVAEMDKADTDQVEPLAHPLDIGQRLRPDAVTETDQRQAFQKIAPSVESGLYLVPQVIED